MDDRTANDQEQPESDSETEMETETGTEGDATEETATDSAAAPAPPSKPKPGPKPKVARLVEKYELAGIGAELETRWTDPENGESLRTLASWFNERVLQSTLASADVETITEDVSYLYALLSGETGSRGERTQVERQLEREGIDVETLTSEFVSYGAIRSYLTGYRDVSPPSRNDAASAATTARTIEGLRQRTVSVTESKLDRLQETDQLRVGPHRVFAEVQVRCEECGKQYDVADLLESGTCDCFESSPTPENV